ncbi:hypothetical protein D3C73_1563280 [compost metagenome]
MGDPDVAFARGFKIYSIVTDTHHRNDFQRLQSSDQYAGYAGFGSRNNASHSGGQFHEPLFVKKRI